MEKPLDEIYASLQKLIGLHRQLVENVRLEREALVSAELKAIQECTMAKQAIIEAIRQAEAMRMKGMTELAAKWQKPLRDLSLGQVVIALQGTNLEAAEKFRSTLNTLTVLIQRITEQNEGNRGLVEKSLEHVREMKKNVLGEAKPRTDTYTPQGQRAGQTGGARLLSKEV